MNDGTDTSIIGTIHDVMDNTFWYLACESCKTKKPRIDKCMKCGCEKFSVRYRITFEVDTKFGTIRMTTFGKDLEKSFGTSADNFDKELKGSSASKRQNFKSFVQAFFVGCAIVLDSKMCSKLGKSKTSSCNKMLSICTDKVHFASEIILTVFDRFKQINCSSPSTVGDRNGFDVSLNLSEIFKLPYGEGGEAEEEKSENNVNNNQSTSSLTSIENSRKFLEDSFIRSLLCKHSFVDCDAFSSDTSLKDKPSTSSFFQIDLANNTTSSPPVLQSSGKTQASDGIATIDTTLSMPLSNNNSSFSSSSSSNSFPLPPLRRIRSILDGEEKMADVRDVISPPLLGDLSPEVISATNNVTPRTQSRFRSRACSTPMRMGENQRDEEAVISKRKHDKGTGWLVPPSPIPTKFRKEDRSLRGVASKLSDEGSIVDTSMDLFM